ncbi:rna-directed dna polymerase from mobile element jockey- hypothetical protein [Limosa lapponica baueri]|uniref:Reverse transcriptase domain-containing protein n=1 Tax=Limosa lapponica baueri TaxID=1758121 RepID=A0A2I0TNF5_LIMLA|nr:rna-directed dna polymerase from mobile element jockey- hypothetical protein [Limosa lapponica baueri]
MLTSLITFFSEILGLVDERRAMVIAYLDFSKTFDTVSHKIIIEKLMNWGLDEQTVIPHWYKTKEIAHDIPSAAEHEGGRLKSQMVDAGVISTKSYLQHWTGLIDTMAVAQTILMLQM